MAAKHPEFRLLQQVWYPCIHGRDTIDSAIVTAIWIRETEDGNEYFYDVEGIDDEGNRWDRELQKGFKLCATEEEAWKKLVSRLRGDRADALHQANLIDQRIKEIEAALENKGKGS